MKKRLTKGLVNVCKKKLLYKEFLKHHNKEMEAKYKKYKNKLISILRKVEKDYYHRLLTDSKENIRQTWTIINKIIRRGVKSKHDAQMFKTNDRVIAGSKR